VSGIFRVLSYGDEVGEGDSVASYCTLGAIAKQAGADLPLLVINELMAFRIGMLLGLPVIPGVVLSDGNRTTYLSLRFGPENEKPPAIIPDELVTDEPELACGVVAFDCLIANADRHDRNLAYQRELIALSLFDHDRALFGKTGTSRLTQLANEHCLEAHCVAQVLTDGSNFRPWMHRLADLKSYQLEAIVAASAREADIGTSAKDAADILCRRRDAVGAMLQKAFDDGSFPAMIQRPLL
jgi:hypothetical protein